MKLKQIYEKVLGSMNDKAQDWEHIFLIACSQT